jgi:hypothetical protein
MGAFPFRIYVQWSAFDRLTHTKKNCSAGKNGHEKKHVQSSKHGHFLQLCCFSRRVPRAPRPHGPHLSFVPGEERGHPSVRAVLLGQEAFGPQTRLANAGHEMHIGIMSMNILQVQTFQ